MFGFIVLLFGMISMHFEWPLIMNWLVTLSWFSSYGNLRDTTTTVLCNLNNLGKRLIKVYMKTLLQMGEPHRHWNNLSIQLSIYQYTSLRRENLKKKKLIIYKWGTINSDSKFLQVQGKQWRPLSNSNSMTVISSFCQKMLRHYFKS